MIQRLDYTCARSAWTRCGLLLIYPSPSCATLATMSPTIPLSARSLGRWRIFRCFSGPLTKRPARPARPRYESPPASIPVPGVRFLARKSEARLILRDGKPGAANGRRPAPPNNWRSVFGGSAWQWDERTGQYYLHSFLRKPDHRRNPELRAAMMDVIRFWLEIGVDGFRLDAADAL